MATSMNRNMTETKSTVALLLVVGEIISNEQRDELCSNLKHALHKIDNKKYHEIADLFNNLIDENEFQTDAQYRQMADTENGSIAGFLYLPNYCTLLNVLKDLFNTCYHVCVLFCGQQIDYDGALILSDSLFTCENFYSLFEENPSYFVEDLRIILPFVSNAWLKLFNNCLKNQLQNVDISDLSDEINENNIFGELFYEKLIQILTNDSINFDINSKLVPRNNAGTIAFDEPNLYILYGQQGETSLFGVRGFVVLVNGGFSQFPSYWNLIRGLQNIDACILTHLDYDVFPGLQTIIHRKTINDGQLCKPDIGAIFLNPIQQAKIQSVHASKSSSNSKLLNNFNDNLDTFLNDVKKLNIDIFDLTKSPISNKSYIEPINLYKKIAFGSLDLYVLHPTSSTSDDEKIVANLQKIHIRDQQPSSSIIPFHHWYSTCALLVWTPSSKSSKDSLVRILYTGACPQTLVFEALSKFQNLEFLHEHHGQKKQHQRQQPPRASNAKPQSSTNVKHPSNKTKVAAPITSRVTPTKTIPNAATSKPKVSQTKTTKPEKSQSTTIPKKTTTSTANVSTRSQNKNKETPKSRTSSSKTNSSKQILTKPQTQNVKPHVDPQQEVKVHNKSEEKLEAHNEHQETEDHQNGEPEQINDAQPDFYSQDEDKDQAEEKNQKDMSPDALNEHNDASIEQHEDETKLMGTVQSENDDNNPLFQSNDDLPMDEIQVPLNSDDQVTTDAVETNSETENALTEEHNNNDNFDEMEIIQHDIVTSTNHSTLSTEEISPQGLPVDNNVQSIKPTVKRLSNTSNGTSGSSKPVNTTKKTLSNNCEQTSSSGSVFNVDVAYIPYHGDERYVDKEFFRRVRARYYVLNAVQISRLTLESLIEGKERWENTEKTPVTLVPTFDGEQLRQFYVMNRNRLAELNINILPASTRCNVQYEDEGSPAQLLRFNSIHNTDGH